ncbi:rhomboid family intramembrane serine protease [Tolypothrix sp. FACHB-123]|uniref:rhomboid family intramembrane serine protease n=1 Tax=Tolypothrix sp. FACHB-123 TaxID=2692868 RepID=UPI00168662B3|nr:rhomboid family intramembrane serine protease [Tolypothrix sp. FACHB-123]MBD2355980.1 rhomboid family intramembrane serine protease [Tolypothrix sp. FACHB-123]
MIPISDNVRTRHRPIINYWLIGINLAVFLWEIQLELGNKLGEFIYSWGVIPAQIAGAMTNAIANPAAWIVVCWRLIALPVGMFLHGSFSQILGNIIFLWVFGKTLENILGHGRYLGFYLLSGIWTALVQIVAEPSLSVPLIGANGAIACILGAYMMKFPQAKIDSVIPLIIVYIPAKLPAFAYLIWWFIQQLFYGIGSLNIPPWGVNKFSMGYWAQAAGLIIGAVFMQLQRRR